MLIDLSTSFQRDGSGAPPPTVPANFDNFVDLSHTVQFLGSRVLDANGKPIVGATISADSGFNYVASVPEASSFVYMALGLASLILARSHIGRSRRHGRGALPAWL